jgi:hypothetical protein
MLALVLYFFSTALMPGANSFFIACDTYAILIFSVLRCFYIHVLTPIRLGVNNY